MLCILRDGERLKPQPLRAPRFAREIAVIDLYCRKLSSLPHKVPRSLDVVAHCVALVSSASIDSMATLTIRQLDEKTKTRLRVRAAHHGRSMEEEAREILRSALRASPAGKQNLSDAVRRRFAEFGGLELELPPRDAAREAPKFGE